MDSKPELSICIPTWNRDKTLNQLLMSITSQPDIEELSKRIEIVVCDNGSEDFTPLLLEFYQKSNPKITIRHIRHERNMGFDYNVCSCFDNARGEYVWLIGDDDAVIFGSIKVVLCYIQSKHDVYIGECLWCEEHLIPIGDANWYDVDLVVDEYDLKTQMIDWLACINNDGAACGFISTMIVKKTFWAPKTDWMGHCFIHRSVIASRPRLKIIRDKVVAMRGDCRFDGPNPHDVFMIHMNYINGWIGLSAVLTKAERPFLHGLVWRQMGSWFGRNPNNTDGIMYEISREAGGRYDEYAVPALNKLFGGD